MSRIPVGPTVRHITYRFQTSDTRMYHFNDVIHRTRAAVLRAGGELRSGVIGLPRQIKRWTVLRSPHVYKKSREKFWMVNHLRIYHWDAPAHVDIDAPMHISRCVPANIAVRMIENVPGLMALKSVYSTIEKVNSASVSSAAQSSSKRQPSECKKTSEKEKHLQNSNTDT